MRLARLDENLNEGQIWSALADLARELGSKIKRVKDILLSSDGAIDNDIQVYINGVDRVEREESDRRKLSEGDTITFMMLIAGG